MTRVLYSARFWKQAARLPIAQQKKLSTLLSILQKDHFDSRLHTKDLEPPLAGTLSFRITRDWRGQVRLLGAPTLFCISVKQRQNNYRSFF